jgi:hypothetical protein
MGHDGADRRKEARYPTSEAAEIELVSVRGEPGPAKTVFGTVLDVSRSGLRLALPVSLNLKKGDSVRVKLLRTTILGVVRYCRTMAEGCQAGLLIQDLERSEDNPTEHMSEDQLSLYALGKGLALTEVIELREHLLHCEACRTRVAETEAVLNAPKRRKARGSSL